MAEEDRKSALVVEDDQEMLGAFTRNLKLRGYEVTPINYLDTRKIPKERFDLAIVDGLDGDGIEVLQGINAERKFLYTGDCRLEETADEAGLEVYSKTESLKEILGEIK